MMVDGLLEHETDHGPVDYAAIARAAGIHAIRVESPMDVPAGSEGGAGATAARAWWTW